MNERERGEEGVVGNLVMWGKWDLGRGEWGEYDGCVR